MIRKGCEGTFRGCEECQEKHPANYGACWDYCHSGGEEKGLSDDEVKEIVDKVSFSELAGHLLDLASRLKERR